MSKDFEDYENLKFKLQDFDGDYSAIDESVGEEEEDEDYDSVLSNIDFSEIRGKDFKKSFSKVNR